MDDPPQKPATIYFFDLDDEDRALDLAKNIATKTGRLITVKRVDGAEIDTVFPTKH